MTEIAIYGTGKTALHLIHALDREECQILAFVETKRKSEKFLDTPVVDLCALGELDFDYLFIASVYYEEIIEDIHKMHEIPSDKIINWQQIYWDLDYNGNDSVRRLFTKDFILDWCRRLESCKNKIYAMGKKYMPYQSCIADDVIFFHDSHDNTIFNYMVHSGSVWEKANIELFIWVAEEYYGVSPDGDGYFLDIGANIGTTCVYVLKKLCPKMKAIAFEPVSKIFSLLKMNVEFNDLSDRCELEKAAISDKQEKSTIWLNPDNLGGNTLLPDEGYLDKEEIQCIRLDDYMISHNLDSKQISYIWIDVEGLELQVLSGGVSILKENLIPIYMELNPNNYNRNLFELVFQELGKIYTHFMVVDEYDFGKRIIQPIQKIFDKKPSDIILLP